MALQHTRSHSFPSATKPALIHVDDSLLSEPILSSFSSFANGIERLEHLYESIDDSLLLPRIQRIITQECGKKCVDEILEGYIILLDACAAAKDLVSLAKRDARDLLSGVRRRDHAEAACKYLKSRRNFRKMVQKALKASAIRTRQSSKASEETRRVESLLEDAQAATSAMLNSLFSYMMRKKVQPTHSSHSLVSMLVNSKKVSSEDGETEFTKVDTALISFMRETKDGDDAKADDLLNYTKNVESSVRIVEDGLERLFRRLIRTRVILLNILSH